ncbi:MAG: DnaA ATPase domain-containing protein [Eubacteriales bacterium]
MAVERIREILQASMGCTFNRYTPEEIEKFKADSFNASTGNLNDEDGYNCDICKNKGLIIRSVCRENGTWSTVARDCKCKAVRNTIRKMRRSGLKDIITDYTFDKFVVTESWQESIKQEAEAFAKSPNGWFFIGGQSGSGKTHICTAICREFLLSGKSVQYMLWRDDIIKLKNAVTDHDEYDSLIARYKTVEVLYIDDLFKTGKTSEGIRQRPTAADINAAFEILNYRYNDKKLITIISSECTINDIIEIDEAVGGRIFERAKKPFSIGHDRSKNYRLRGAVEL